MFFYFPPQILVTVDISRCWLSSSNFRSYREMSPFWMFMDWRFACCGGMFFWLLFNFWEESQSQRISCRIFSADSKLSFSQQFSCFVSIRFDSNHFSISTFCFFCFCIGKNFLLFEAFFRFV